MEGYGGPAQPSPTIRQCLNGGLGWLKVECNGCNTRASLPLDAIRRPRDTPLWKLEPSLKCRSCRKGRYAPPVHMIKLTATLGKPRADTKNAQVIAMLRDRNGTTIAAIMAATGWQQHSVRGFLAGVVRKKLGLNLVSEPSESGRVYRIIDDMASPAKADRVNQAA
jgi:Protein of unknown function (DUF3489)